MTKMKQPDTILLVPDRPVPSPTAAYYRQRKMRVLVVLLFMMVLLLSLMLMSSFCSGVGRLWLRKAFDSSSDSAASTSDGDSDSRDDQKGVGQLVITRQEFSVQFEPQENAIDFGEDDDSEGNSGLDYKDEEEDDEDFPPPAIKEDGSVPLVLLRPAAKAVVTEAPETHEQQVARANAFVNADAGVKKLWNEFKLTFSKTYRTITEEMKRFETWLANRGKIEAHNREFQAGKRSFEMGMNEFGDLSSKEFAKQMNGFKRNYGDSMASGTGAAFLPPLNYVAPDAVDWRQHGYVTPVKNQGSCGSCWAFSSTGSLEGQHFRKLGKLVSLSEQNLVDCSGKFGNQGCNGGLMDQAFQYIKANKGIDTEKSYPYEAEDDKCRFKRADVGADDKGFVDVASGDEDQLKTAVATVGPVSVAIDASHESFQFYKKGIYDEPDCSSENLDHGVLTVGYGVAQDTGDLFWIVKNSWGPKWGEEGYIRMPRNQNNTCGIATKASYPLV